jgi:hypothetical protein
MPKINVNGVDWDYSSDEIAYEDVVRAAWDKLPHEPPLMTVTYYWRGPGDSERHGTLYPGKPPIKVENGMVFNAVNTGNA